MKRTLFIILTVFMTFYASAQGTEFEFNLGFTIGDLKDDLGMESNGKGGYLWEVAPRFSLGPLVGISYIFSNNGATLFGDSLGFTISAAGRYDLSEKVYLGGDLGYGTISAGNGTEGIYYRPVIGFKVGERLSIIASYTSLNLNESEGKTFIRVNKGSTLNTIQMGLSIR
ncbi:hypothetical protein [Aestuariivivens sediminis]|uniref:hypothetical protein n=1 Tax=Aestuariivivens sediminis TaxID=2913557 RepID=UPI001F597467|nr:hypothetical protein [Aestuariivivens sediminis]